MKEYPSDICQIAASSLLTRVVVNENQFFDNQSFDEKWRNLNEFDNPLKIVAGNYELEVVVKTFAPVTGDYNERHYNALSALQDLSNKVLMPLGLAQNVIVFQQGRLNGRVGYRNYFTTEERQHIADVARRNKIDYLSEHSGVEIVEIDGNDYAVDIFDDGRFLRNYL